jgi:cardiolipin synthase
MARMPRASSCSRLVVVTGAVCGLVFACSTLPRVPPEAATNPPPILAGANGELSPERSKAILKAVDRRSGGSELLKNHLSIEEEITEFPLVIGNRVTLLQDGPATYKAMYIAIRAAKYHIDLETYILADDEVGRQLADLLIDKRAQGVQVNVMYDSVGSLSSPETFFKRMADHGINVVQFNPSNPLEAKKGWDVNRRDHRKLLIADGRVAFTGGINYSGVYSGGSFGRPSRRPASAGIPWRDTHLQIEGPVVAEFQKLFLQTWNAQKGPPLSGRHYFPAIEEKGTQIVRAIGTAPDTRPNLLYGTLVSAISHAEYSVHLTNAYFVPDPQLVLALQDAAKRGVDVRLILPSQTDFWAPLYAGRSHYYELLQAGVKIYERRAALLHAKTGVIDAVWSTVGSSNLDWRSFLHNYELDAVVLGPEFGAEMEAAFNKDLAESTRIEIAAWNQRSLGSRMREAAARIWEYWL